MGILVEIHGVSMTHYPFTVSFPVHWGDMDAFGHVNHTRYLVWMETARIKLFDEIGLDWRDGSTPGPILANLNVDYLEPVHFPARLKCGLCISRVGNTSFVIDYGIWFEDEPERLVCRCQSVIVVYNYATQSKTPIWDDLRLGLGRFEPTPQ